MSHHPSVRWAQRSDMLYITIDLPDAKDVKLKLDPEGKFFFSATSGAEKIPYEIDFDLYDKVDVNESNANVGLRNICYLVKKAENKWWNRLLKQEGKTPVFLKVDWDKWVDEDEEHEAKPEEEKSGGDMDFGDFDFSKLNMGGGGGGGEGLDFSKLNMGGGSGEGLDFSKLNMGGGGGEGLDDIGADKDEENYESDTEEENVEEAPSAEPLDKKETSSAAGGEPLDKKEASYAAGEPGSKA